ncbi:MAG: hypothetical protein ACOYK7_03195 [Pirellulales bacterium]|jgi:hypothetical protein
MVEKTMEWELRHSGLAEAAELRDLLDVRLRMALGRFRGRVTRLVVLLQGGHEPRGGIDKSCRIRAQIRGVGDVRGMVVDSDWRMAIERAAQAIAQSVAHEIDRARRQPRPAALGNERPPCDHGERSWLSEA